MQTRTSNYTLQLLKATSVSSTINTHSSGQMRLTAFRTGLVQYALTHGQPANSVLDGILPLHAAASGGNELVVKLLIDFGADVNAPRSVILDIIPCTAVADPQLTFVHVDCPVDTAIRRPRVGLSSVLQVSSSSVVP